MCRFPRYLLKQNTCPDVEYATQQPPRVCWRIPRHIQYVFEHVRHGASCTQCNKKVFPWVVNKTGETGTWHSIFILMEFVRRSSPARSAISKVFRQPPPCTAAATNACVNILKIVRACERANARKVVVSDFGMSVCVCVMSFSIYVIFVRGVCVCVCVDPPLAQAWVGKWPVSFFVVMLYTLWYIFFKMCFIYCKWRPWGHFCSDSDDDDYYNNDIFDWIFMYVCVRARTLSASI